MIKSILTIATIAGLALSLNVASASAKPYAKYQKHQRFVAVSLPQIRKQLRRKGYNRIVYTDRRLPVYQAKACKNGKRFNIRMNRRGGIISRNRIGRCFG